MSQHSPTSHTDNNEPLSAIIETMADFLDNITPVDSLPPLVMPYYDNMQVAAGFPVPLDNDELAQNVDLLRMLCPNPEASYLVRVHGDSMIGVGIYDGDILIVDKAKRSPSEHDVAVCELNGEYTIKHVANRQGTLLLIPANPTYPQIEISPEDTFCIWGTVIFTIHKPRE